MATPRNHTNPESVAEVIALPVKSAQTPPELVFEGREKIGDATVSCRLEVPEIITDPVPLAIAPGLLGDQWAYRGVSDYIVAQGKPVLTWKFPRKQGVRGLLNPTHNLYPQKLACQSLYSSIRHMRSRDDLPGEVSVDRVDAVGHSRGGPTIARTAIKKPDLFRTIIFDSPAGFEDHDTMMMMGRLVPFFKDELLPTLMKQETHASSHVALQGLASYILANPLRTAMEAIDVSKENVTDMLSHSNLSGIPKALYGYASDPLINIHKSIKKSGHLVDLTKIHSEPTMGHLGPQRVPEEVGQDYLDIIQDLQSQKQSRAPKKTRAKKIA